MGEPQEKEMQVLVIKKKERKKRVGQQAQNWWEPKRYGWNPRSICPRSLPLGRPFSVSPLEACQSWAGKQGSFKEWGHGRYRLSAALTAMGESTGHLSICHQVKHQQYISRHQHTGLWCSDICALWASSQMAYIPMSWDRNEEKRQIPHDIQKGHKEGLVKWATPWRLLILSYEKVRVQVFPYLWQLRVTQLIATSDRNSTLKVHWAPRNPFSFSSEGCTNNSRWHRSITKLLNVSNIFGNWIQNEPTNIPLLYPHCV